MTTGRCWSKGATATALVMNADRRVRAGLALDGPMQPTITTDLDRPFMLMTAEFTRAAEPSVAGFWSHLRGWRRNLQALKRLVEEGQRSADAASQRSVGAAGERPDHDGRV